MWNTITGEALIALGANLPAKNSPPEATLVAALAALEQNGARITRRSRLWRTPAFPAGSGPDYVNAVAALTYSGSPAELLGLLHRIEADFGRERLVRWGGRVLDLDLLAIGEFVLPTPEAQDLWRGLLPEKQTTIAPEELILPHPRLQDRAFVLVPMAEVAPDWRHPRTGESVTEMLAALPEADRAAVHPLK